MKKNVWIWVVASLVLLGTVAAVTNYADEFGLTTINLLATAINATQDLTVGDDLTVYDIITAYGNSVFKNLTINRDIKNADDPTTWIRVASSNVTMDISGSSEIFSFNVLGLKLGNTGARVTSIQDNDALGTSDTVLCTQGNVKAYVDTNTIKNNTNAYFQNLGIGISTPTSTLHVVGIANITSSLWVNDAPVMTTANMTGYTKNNTASYFERLGIGTTPAGITGTVNITGNVSFGSWAIFKSGQGICWFENCSSYTYNNGTGIVDKGG